MAATYCAVDKWFLSTYNNHLFPPPGLKWFLLESRRAKWQPEREREEVVPVWSKGFWFSWCFYLSMAPSLALAQSFASHNENHNALCSMSESPQGSIMEARRVLIASCTQKCYPHQNLAQLNQASNRGEECIGVLFPSCASYSPVCVKSIILKCFCLIILIKHYYETFK